ncbi:hypothetical protein AERO8C_90107 [Aeromonas veronii]|uniref:Uncharacterized protein n=1 Tax=Aeromonas veronii TaxID=654 RepID=A0A653LCN6_AERVE|nr:hypothetical protein AERO8C_90107 [Aeromonas veronii]
MTSRKTNQYTTPIEVSVIRGGSLNLRHFQITLRKVHICYEVFIMMIFINFCDFLLVF